MSRHPQLETILQKLKAGLEELYGDRLVHVILYGSQARGDAEEFSDIDVLVVLEGEVDRLREIDRTSELMADLSLEYNTVLSRMFFSREQFEHENINLLRNVRREGVAI